jgi:peptidyl-prolyl cis-trans isomerase C
MSRSTFDFVSSARSLPVLVLIGLVLLAGCRQKPGTEDEDANQFVVEPNVVVDPRLEASVAAKVNDVNIMQAEVDELVEASLAPFRAKPEQFSDAFIEQRAKEFEVQHVRALVVGQLLDDEVKKQGVTVTDQDVLERVTELAQQQTPKMTLQEFTQKVEANGESVQTFEARVKRQIGWDKLAESKIADDYIVTEEEALAYFNEHPENFNTIELAKASHIVIRPVDESDPNMKAEAKASAEDLLRQLKEGADFAELAMDYSEDATGFEGGDLGYFKRGDMELSFEKVAFSLPVGQLSDVVETSFGYHIIKVVDYRPSESATFEAVKGPLMAKLSQNAKTELVRQYFLSLQEKAEIIVRKQ